nr:NADH dehydrogenase subunit 3 [Anatoecus icterodes]UTT72541.1 NADH dehydrogenase subunit 3 [Anatoecus icterodes]
MVNYPLIYWLVSSMLMIFILMFMGILSSKEDESTNSNSPFECGMDSMQNCRLPMSMHFFLVSILFLVFDMEFILSIPPIFMMSDLKNWMAFWYLYLFILIGGLMIELFMGSLDWKE